MKKRRQHPKVRTTTNARQSSRGSPGTKPPGQGWFSRTSGCDACSGRPFIGFRGSGTSFYNTLGTIDGSGALSGRTFESQGGSAASPRATLSPRAAPREVPSATFERWDVKRGDQRAPSGPKKFENLLNTTVRCFRVRSAPDRARIVSGSSPDRLYLPSTVQIYY